MNLTVCLLGDHQFPGILSSNGNRSRIDLFQYLYEIYSKRALTVLTDKSVAISGLESRLERTFDTEGSYGIFQCYLHRSILCQRSGDKMERTAPPPGLSKWKVPSWSWMAYKGGINYMDISFNEVEWSNVVKWLPSELEL